MNYCEIGVDEAGRGPIAGPVAVAAVGIIDSEIISTFFPNGIKDSKKMTAKARQYCYNTIIRYAKEGRLRFTAGFISAQSIDELGIVPSCTAGVAGVLDKLRVGHTESVMLDGRLYAPKQYSNQASFDKGDEQYPGIALASVVAKQLRDQRMVELGNQYPAYGFEQHRGYGTKAHYEALLRHGLSKEHRRTFLKRFLKERKNPHS